jgi:hypothetical protein
MYVSVDGHASANNSSCLLSDPQSTSWISLAFFLTKFRKLNLDWPVELIWYIGGALPSLKWLYHIEDNHLLIFCVFSRDGILNILKI